MGTAEEVYAVKVMVGARKTQLRTGQWLFNNLPRDLGNRLAGTVIDPFHKDLSKQEIIEWLNNHVIFDNERVIALFQNNTILWEAPPTTPN